LGLYKAAPNQKKRWRAPLTRRAAGSGVELARSVKGGYRCAGEPARPMLNILSPGLKSKLAVSMGFEVAMRRRRQLSDLNETVKSVAKFARPGYWASAPAYEQFARDGYRLVKISYPDRVGHLCLETDALLKDMAMQGHDTKKLVMVDIKERFANPHIVGYFKRYLTVVDSSPVADFVRSYGDPHGVLIDTQPYALALFGTAKAFEIYAKWGDREPLFELLSDDRESLRDYLSEAGLPADAWYVCVHAREGGYNSKYESMHRYRNVDIATYSQAIEEIARRGGWCVRVGDSSMRPHPKHPRVIDYALSERKSPQLDVALPAGCRFFLGSASGAFNLADLFGRPCVITNMAPLSNVYASKPTDLSIAQRLRDRNGRYLAFSEIMQGECAEYRLNEQFVAHGLECVRNTPEDIRDVVVELLDRLDGTAVYTEDDVRRQREFRGYFHEGHYSCGAASSIGRDFLRKYGQ
jgi:putative glycosyltransferase (TIGR04372 family)